MVMPLRVPASTKVVYGITYFLDAFWVLGIELGGGRSEKRETQALVSKNS